LPKPKSFLKYKSYSVRQPHRLVQKAGKRLVGLMRSTPDEIRRRIAKRKKDMGSSAKNPDKLIMWPGDEDKYTYDPWSSKDQKNDDDGIHPLFKKEVFIFKILASVLLFLVVGILFRNTSETFEPARNLVNTAMEKDFQFATVAKWYEDQFGKPLALLPYPDGEKEDDKTIVDKPNSVPVFSGKVLENFEKDGQGIMIETTNGAPVEAMNEGNVMFAGVKEGLGKTVIIQHPDQTETWYANLADLKVSLYEYVKKETVVGTASESTGEDKTKGKYYFAYKKGDDFIDPIQVIRFE
jgi:stage IV sporulation protein FA